MDVIIEQADLPHAGLASAWTAIKLPERVRERLLAHAVLALQLRQQFAFEVTQPSMNIIGPALEDALRLCRCGKSCSSI